MNHPQDQQDRARPPDPPAAESPAAGDDFDFDREVVRGSWLRRLLDASAQPFAIINIERAIVHTNLAFAGLLGFTPEELLGRSILDLTAPESQELTRRYQSDILETGKSERVVKSYRHKDGRLVPVEMIVDLVRDDAGRARGLYAFITDISDRVSAEQALRLSEQRHRQLYDEAPVGYHQIDREGRITSINRTACELLGYTAEELLGRPVLDLVVPEEREQARGFLAERLAGERDLAPFQQVLATRSGQPLEVEIQEREQRDAAGRIIGLRGVLQDITQRKRTEAALVNSERRARALFDGIHDAVLVYDRDGRVLDVNPAACRLLGYPREEIIGSSTSQIEAPEFAAGFEQRLERRLQEGRLAFEGLHRTRDGRLIPVEVTTSTMEYDHQVAVLAVLRDVTERRALERTRREFATAQMRNAQELELSNRALSESEARYRRLAEASLDAIIVADGDGRITLFNPASETVFGYPSGEILGRPLADLIPGIFSAPAPAPPLEGSASTDDPAREGEPAEPAPRPWQSPVVGRTVELIGRKRDGTEFPLEISLSAFEANGKLQYIGSIRDQTERHRMRAVLVHTEKLASIGLLSAGVAHEINNPLAYVLNNIVVLQRDVRGLLELLKLNDSVRESLRDLDPQTHARITELEDEIDWPYLRDNLERMIERTQSGVKRVASIVEKLRGLAHTSPLKWERISLSDLVESTIEVVRGRLRQHQVELAVRVDESIRLECVADQIGQVLLNLVINAIQTIEGSGPGERGRIEIVGERSGALIAISVRDNGAGIDSDHLGRIFDPFFTTKPVGEGTGLGLAISHGIITGHGGSIDVESRLGAGTCFRILLPERHEQRPGSGNVPAFSPSRLA